DYPANTLARSQLRHLYARADLALVCSRSEGGPHSVLEAAAAGCAQLSTRVGIAPDVLNEECLYGDPGEAVEKIEADIARGALKRYVPVHRSLVEAAYSVEANRERWKNFYAGLGDCGLRISDFGSRIGDRGTGLAIGGSRIACDVAGGFA